MAPVVKTLNENNFFETKVCVTAQHREMLDQVLDFFEIVPDFDLNLMKPNQNLHNLTGEIINGIKDVLGEFKADYVLVHGDTTTTMAVSIASFYSGSKICHVEAGLRTYNLQAPFPEEMNRQVTARMTDFHFAPTEKSKNNLILENIKEDNIIVTGNTVIDALLDGVKKVNNIEFDDINMLKSIINQSKDLVVVTGHRRENHGEGFLNICRALKKIAMNDNVQIIYPVHLNPNVQKPVNEILSNIDNINLIKPLPYEAFLWLMEKSKIIITDSGGVQEEAPSLGKPVLVMRNTTERPEAVEAGTVILVGTNVKKIVDETNILLSNNEKYEAMSKLHNPYGDGHASQRIVQFLLNQIK